MQRDPNQLFQQPGANPNGALTPYHQQEVSAPLLISADEPEEAQLPLSHYVWLVRTHWIQMCAFIAFAVIATAMVTARLTPLYEAKTNLYLDRNAAKNLVGQDSQSGSANKGDTDNYLASQIDIVQSDAVLRPVKKQFGLEALPKDSSEASRIRAERQNAAPAKLPGLTVTRPPNTYLLAISYQSPNPVRAAQVANAIADSYQTRIFEMRLDDSGKLKGFMGKQLADLEDKTRASQEKVASLEKELAMINPDQKTNIASSSLQQVTTNYGSI